MQVSASLGILILSVQRMEVPVKMLGKFCPTGPGGRDCVCCGDAPGKYRKVSRRHAKRSERQKWRKEVLKD